MDWDELGRDAEDKKGRRRDRLIGVYIGLLAVVLAICSMGGNNAAKEATRKNIETTNIWAFFQAKNIRRHVLRMQVEEYEILRQADPALSEAAKTAIDARIAAYKAQDRELTSDETSGEGLDQLWMRGKALEAERDRALQQDPYFDYAEAFLQIAIILASVAIISGGNALLICSAVLSILGGFLTFNGFTLLVAIPFLG